jgi:RNA polymerase sigma-70 factor (ECF subfamily)
MKQEDAALIAAISEGDVPAFERLYRRYRRPVAGIVYRLTGRPGVVEELVNDVMVVVWQKAGTFAGRSAVSTWIMGVAYNTALKAIRKFGRTPTFVEVDADAVLDEAGPDQHLADSERRRRVLRALDELSPQHRAVVELTYYLGYTYGEIAQIMDCPENTVKTRMFHARKRLRRLLTPSRPSPRRHGKAGSG